MDQEKYKKAIERQGRFGKLFLDYTGCPRGAVGRSACVPIEEDVMSMPVITDVDGGRWIPVNADALEEMVSRYKSAICGHWDELEDLVNRYKDVVRGLSAPAGPVGVDGAPDFWICKRG